MTDESLKSRMLTDAMLIFDSVAFLDRQINNKMAEIDEAENNGYDGSELALQLKSLLSKIDKENDNMDIFMQKYEKEVTNEKKTILSDIK